jgi:hypothetical protein
MIQTLKAINQTVGWYDSLPPDFSDIDLLLNARRLLSTRLYKLAQCLADASREKNASEHKRKSFEARRRYELREAEKGKVVVSHIDVTVAQQAIPYVMEEAEKEREFISLKIIYSAAVNVCDVMNQHLAHLRAEKGREMSGQGGQ